MQRVSRRAESAGGPAFTGSETAPAVATIPIVNPPVPTGRSVELKELENGLE